MPRRDHAGLALALAWICGSAAAAEVPAVRALQVQQVGNQTYFRLRLAAPAGLYLPPLVTLQTWGDPDLRALAQLPRLVPQDRHTRDVYLRLAIPEAAYREIPVLTHGELEFVGRWQDPDRSGPVRLLLLYATEEEKPAPGDAPLAGLLHRHRWREVPLELDLSGAVRLPGGDLEQVWAASQAARFAVLEVEAGEPTFFTLARQLTGRKYGVRAAPLLRPTPPEIPPDFRRLYETTTGATAIAETLQLQRVLAPDANDHGERTVPVDRIPDIGRTEQPWEKLLAGRKPEVEALAKLVPDDNYYLHFRNFSNFLELSDMLEQWGVNILGVYQVVTLDYRPRERALRQIALRDTPLLRRLAAFMVRDLAVSGSDVNFAEGSDFTLILDLSVNGRLFLTGAQPFIQEVRDEFGGRLREKTEDYHGITIESFVTPLREVSLYRAVRGNLVFLSNSPAGLRRVLDTVQGRRPAVSDAPDFRYLRTVFPLSDRREDGFVFLSETCVRRLLGPATKIKEKRRQEAVTTLTRATHAALFSTWETGRLPGNREELLASSGLKATELALPAGVDVRWDGRLGVASSDVYNTLRFVTPLLELPIDRVTPAEERAYLRFRQEYLGQSPDCLDPIAIRLILNERQLAAETVVFPLIRNSLYNELRRWTDGRTTTLDVAPVRTDTLMQFLAHLSPEGRAEIAKEGTLGDWCFFRLDDSALYGRLAELQVRQALDPARADALQREAGRVFLQLPLLAGFRVGDRRLFDEMLVSFGDLLNLGAGPFATVVQPAYRGVAITRLQFDPGSRLAEQINDPDTPRQRRFAPTLYHAYIDDAWYITPQEDLLRQLIDSWAARRAGLDLQPRADPVPVHDSLYVAPKAAVKARDALGFYLEWENHRRALAGSALWEVLFHDGLLPEDLDRETMQAVALRTYGFVPISPEGAAYAYDVRRDEVVNERHGSLQRPRLRAGIDADSPFAQLLDEFRIFRADLRFTDDGIHATVTIARRPAR